MKFRVARVFAVFLLLPSVSFAQDVAAIAARRQCSTAGVVGISTQLVETQQCLYPGTFVSVVPRTGVTLSSSRLFPYMQASARTALWNAAARTGLQVNSMFRTLADQYVLYYSGACGLAARPGNSNHETGTAVDLQNWSAAMSAMTAAGCRHPYPGTDDVHFDCPGTDRRSDSIRTFQRLWNVNNAADRIAEDGVYGPMTEARLARSPAGGFARNGCDVTPPMCESRVAPFAWNCNGPISGMTCVLVQEGADPDGWDNNYFCSQTNLGIRWSSSGLLPGMRCTAITEGSEPAAHTWPDNYLCVPDSTPYRFEWSSAGPITGQTCLRWYEPQDPHTWGDNYLCWTPFAPMPDAGGTDASVDVVSDVVVADIAEIPDAGTSDAELAEIATDTFVAEVVADTSADDVRSDAGRDGRADGGTGELPPGCQCAAGTPSRGARVPWIGFALGAWLLLGRSMRSQRRRR